MSDTQDHLAILQVSTADRAGGAEQVAWNLLQQYRARGFGAWLAVGRALTDEPSVLQIAGAQSHNVWVNAWRGLGARLQPYAGSVRGVGRLRSLSLIIAEPRRLMGRLRGHEDFSFPGTWRLLEMTPERPTILHCHNLHGGYFDLRALPHLSASLPTILTLHDAWLLSGHCAHSFDCERWKTGCGHCPDLSIYPSVLRDATAENWRTKQQILARSHLYVATPSQWLMDKVQQSMLVPAIVEARVIPNGVDLSVFRPADRQSVRSQLGVPNDTAVLLFVASGIRKNIFKDYDTMQSVLAGVAGRLDGRRLVFFALGENAPAQRVGSAELRFVPFQEDRPDVARYYQAADVYVHAAKVDTFPTTVLEALACGTPVVATEVGGIPEQVQDRRTGMLTPPGNSAAMTEAIVTLLNDDRLRRALGGRAADDARERFDLKRRADDYVSWYREILARRRRESGEDSSPASTSLGGPVGFRGGLW